MQPHFPARSQFNQSIAVGILIVGAFGSACAQDETRSAAKQPSDTRSVSTTAAPVAAETTSQTAASSRLSLSCAGASRCGTPGDYAVSVTLCEEKKGVFVVYGKAIDPNGKEFTVGVSNELRAGTKDKHVTFNVFGVGVYGGDGGVSYRSDGDTITFEFNGMPIEDYMSDHKVSAGSFSGVISCTT